MSRPDIAGGAGVRLDLLVARYGPMPEEMVRALGCVVARAVLAQHALGRADSVIDPVHIEVVSGGPRLLEIQRDGATVPLAGDAVGAIARVMVFVAAGEPSRPELLPVSQGLRELLQACLSDGSKPSLAELAQLLDGPPPGVWLPAEPIPSSPAAGSIPVGATTAVSPPAASTTAVSMPTASPAAPPPPTAPLPTPPIPGSSPATHAVSHPDYSGPQQFPMPVSNPPGRSQRLPWVITAVCWAAIALISTGTAVALDVRDSGGPPTYDPAKATNLCDLLDLPPLEKLAGKTERPPENSVFEYGESRSLLCFGSLEHGSLSANANVDIGQGDVASFYRSGKAVTLGTTAEGVTSGTSSEIGEDGYFSVTKPDSGGSVGCKFGFIDGNLTMSIDFTILEDPGISRDDLRTVCQNQARTVRERMR